MHSTWIDRNDPRAALAAASLCGLLALIENEDGGILFIWDANTNIIVTNGYSSVFII